MPGDLTEEGHNPPNNLKILFIDSDKNKLYNELKMKTVN